MNYLEKQNNNLNVKKISKKYNLLVSHCKGGIGRAGTIAGCLLHKLGIMSELNEMLIYLRKYRHPRCVESKRQEEYIEKYIQKIKIN